MKLAVVAVGTRMPDWADAAFADFGKRMPQEASLSLTEIRPEPRSGGKPVAALLAAEAMRIRNALPPRSRLVVLDEKGRDLTTAGLAERLRSWLAGGRDVALVIGGPDGLAAEIKTAADESLRLSSLTLPHALARVLLAEALYRATTILKNHPYHRA
jgi:23S rRNA (pseudouridine1915-N3)-methyltransferase